MKRLHVHISVDDIARSRAYYTALFGAEPAVSKDDYAKWLLDEPAVNIAISKRSSKTGVDHLGIQLDSDDDLDIFTGRLAEAGQPARAQDNATCCYAQSNKTWTRDPQGTVWELFHSFDGFETYGNDDHQDLIAVQGEAASCCAPAPAGESCCAPSDKA